MKRKFKRMISFLTAAVLLITTASFSTVQAYDTDEKEASPFVFVHGFGGWGDYDEQNENLNYWGTGSNEINAIDILNDNGFRAYAASVGPMSSAWDRACELYAQLSGTVVDYGEAHSKAHNHERFGKSFVDKPLIGENWDLSEPINLVGHSFGAATSRLLVSLLAFGDEAEKAATGEDVSPLFAGGHSKAVHSVTTLSGVHNGTQMANMIYDFLPSMYAFSFLINLLPCFGVTLPVGDINLAHFGLTPKQGEKASISLKNIRNFVKAEDNAGYDLTIRGSRELNERIKLSPDTYYYSYSGYVTEKNSFGYQKNTSGCAPIFEGTCAVISMSKGRTFDSVKMTDEWTVNDGLVPLASAKYPFCDTDKALSYEQAIENGDTVVPGMWYYFEPMYGIDHGDYCYTDSTLPGGFTNFYIRLAEIAA